MFGIAKFMFDSIFVELYNLQKMLIHRCKFGRSIGEKSENRIKSAIIFVSLVEEKN